MIKNVTNTLLQNKNAIMFITAIIFMCGILAYFNDNGILCAAIITAISLITIIKNYVPTKYVLFWIFIFYFGFFTSYFKIKPTDELVTFAPQKVSIQGQVVSIPNNSIPKKTKFFFI